MLTLGGDLKRKEMISARLGDGLSYLYMASAALKKYEEEGRQQGDLDFVHYAVQHCLYNASKSLNEAYTNFPVKYVGGVLKGLLFPLGNHFNKPSDELCVNLAEAMMTPGAQRDRLTHLCYIGKSEDDSVGLMENAFLAMYDIKPLERKLMKAAKDGKVARKGLLHDRLQQAFEAGVLTE
ncbi:acyl-CoA dehydrogenase domain-containing protein, partial [Vibrio parahaemolyticus]|uniref:acyl-CoA dehydrogenase domain-containing protein n=2 Tax=Vibrionaceae TaxID=641 RepID=UPI00155F1DB3